MAYQEYPAYRWTKAGEQVYIFDISEDAPGLLRTHPDNPDPDAFFPTVPYTGERIRELLAQGSIEFNPELADEALRGVLNDGLVTQLKKLKISFRTGAPVEELYTVMMTSIAE